MQDSVGFFEQPSMVAVAAKEHEDVKWNCHTHLEKFSMKDLNDLKLPTGMSDQEILDEMIRAGLTPFEVMDIPGNILLHGGASILWEALIGAGPTAFSNANAHIGVGDSSAAAVATQTDLQAASNKLRKAMNPGYPDHEDGTASDNASVVWQATFGTADANFSWQEWGIFNASAGGRMLNRRVIDLGTKVSWASFQVTLITSLA